MGGPGSGRRWYAGDKSLTDDYRSVDVRRWAREGLLRPGRRATWQWTCNGEVEDSIRMRAEEGQVVLTYRHRSRGDEWRDTEYPVRIVRTSCNAGGSRPWFVCPVARCRRRVAILYGGAIFACRHCHQLAYPSTREEGADRAVRRADRIRERLGWQPGVLNGRGGKPKWMRWATYMRLCDEHNMLVISALRAMVGPYGPVDQDEA